MTALATHQGEAFLSLVWLRTHGVRIGVVLLLAVLLSGLGGLGVRRVRKRLEGPVDATRQVNLKRAATLTAIMANVVRVVVWTVAILTILAEVGINLGPLLAGAGIAGVALGFGAQSLVRDFLAGFFVLLEDQFAVGDYVEISAVGGTVRGRVEALTLRTTAIRQDDGTLTVVPNGGMQVVSNKSRGQGRVTVEVRIPREEDPGEVERRLDELLEELQRSPEVRRLVSAGPWKVAVEPVDEEVSIRVAGETRPYRREQVEQELARRIRQAFLATPSF
ncbi:MAG TPA: mechanosensitive ion channel family protein [Actinomycetota bacterium]|nr:mechanosensitive ion channel family protein [Actinomycetota bacterium]